MKFLIQGYYGRSNFGDDLLLRVVIDQLRSAFDGCLIRVLCHGPGADRMVEDIGIERRYLIENSETALILKTLRWADVFIWGGGTCLHDSGFCGYWRNVAAKACGCKVVWLGIGVDVIRRVRSKCRARISVASCDLMMIRDEDSYRKAKEMFPSFRDIRLTEDLVWLHSFSGKIQDPAQGELLISWRDFTKYLDASKLDRFIEKMVQFTLCAIRDGVFSRVCVVNAAGTVDYDANAKVFNALKIAFERDCPSVTLSFLGRPSLGEILNSMRKASFLLSGRMHPFIVSKLMGIPSLPIAYAAKVNTYASYFEGQGVIPLLEPVSSTEMYDLVRLEMSNAPKLKEGIDVLRQKSEQNINHLKCLLNADS